MFRYCRPELLPLLRFSVVAIDNVRYWKRVLLNDLVVLRKMLAHSKWLGT